MVFESQSNLPKKSSDVLSNEKSYFYNKYVYIGRLDCGPSIEVKYDHDHKKSKTMILYIGKDVGRGLVYKNRSNDDVVQFMKHNDFQTKSSFEHEINRTINDIKSNYQYKPPRHSAQHKFLSVVNYHGNPMVPAVSIEITLSKQPYCVLHLARSFDRDSCVLGLYSCSELKDWLDDPVHQYVLKSKSKFTWNTVANPTATEGSLLQYENDPAAAVGMFWDMSDSQKFQNLREHAAKQNGKGLDHLSTEEQDVYTQRIKKAAAPKHVQEKCLRDYETEMDSYQV